MPTIVFYGAGQEARKRLAEWEAKGLVPVCFADADPLKHYTKISTLHDTACSTGKVYDVLPLEVVKKRYPDYVLYLTLANNSLYPVTEWLQQNGIPSDRIKYTEPVELRWGCKDLGQFLHIWRNALNDCCVPQHAGVKIDGSKSYGEFWERSQKTIERFRNNEFGDCTGCSELRKQFWPITPQKYTIGLGSDLPGDRCCFKCMYCRVSKERTLSRADGRIMDYIRPLKAFIESKKIVNPCLYLATGEFGLWKDCHEAIQFIAENKWDSYIMLTGFFYMSDMAKLNQNGTTTLNISLDAGTEETFFAIKGVNAFQRVLANLRSYRRDGIPIELKYIMINGINDNERDMDGFIQIAEEIATRVALSHAIMDERNPPLTETMRRLFRRLILHLKDKKIPMYVHNFGALSNEDAIFLQELIDQPSNFEKKCMETS